MNFIDKTICILLFFIMDSCISHAQNSFWVKQIGGDSTVERSRAIAVDKFGNTYITGNFRDTVDFDPGPGVFNLITSPFANLAGNPFILKLDASGNFVWAKAFTSPTVNGEWGTGYAIAADDSGNVYTTGEFWGNALDFDPGPGTFNLPFTGQGDCYISKLDKYGNFVWAQKYADPSPNTRESGLIIKPDSSGNVYVYANNYYSFQSDVILLKLNPNGNIAWTKTISGSGDESIAGLDLGNDGNLYITGTFQSTIYLSPFTLSGMGYVDTYISMLDTSGNIIWVKQIGGHYIAGAMDMVLDNNLNMFITGYLRDTVDFDPGPGVYYLTSAGNDHDIFITKLDSAGNFVWAKSMGGNSDDRSISLVLDSAINIYSVGTFRDTVDFDPGAGVFSMTSIPPFSNMYICKLDSAGNFIYAKQSEADLSQCFSCLAIDNAASIYTTGGFMDTTDFDLGPGVFNLISSGSYDIFIHKFRECIPSSGTHVITACDSLTWIDGITYTTSTNTPVHTIIGGSSVNCDSIVTLNLTVTYSTSSTDSITACDSLTWIDGITYTSGNNTATYTLTNSVGCDSVVALNLTINNVNVSVSLDTLTSILTAVPGASAYQWLDCANGYSAISGATSQAFAPAQNGNYAVAITQNGCTDTSACIPVVIVSMAEVNHSNYFNIHPNPASGTFSIHINGLPQLLGIIEIYNTSSQLIFTTSISNNLPINVDMSLQPDGIYLVMLKTKGDWFSKKIIILN